jgi:hypothetical protein
LHDAPAMRLLAAIPLLCFACGVEDAPEDDPDNLRAIANGLDRNRLIEDSHLVGDQDVTVSQIQALLQSQGSALANYSEGGRTAAQWIVQESKAQTISPVYMVARIETESSLIRSGTLNKLEQATGCGCPDGAVCDPNLAGFGLQVRCAAELVRGYLKDLDAKNATITGWGVGVGKSTSDPCWVVPQNKATAALYTYTPWVGAWAAVCGTPQWGGSSLVGVLVRHFKSKLPAGGGSCPLGNGLYCGGNMITGSANTLYRCTNGSITVEQTCSAGCYWAPNGQADACVDTTQTCTFGNGLYCGGNGIIGNANTLYSCQNGAISVSKVCTAGCAPQPTGFNDVCK